MREWLNSFAHTSAEEEKSQKEFPKGGSNVR